MENLSSFNEQHVQHVQHRVFDKIKKTKKSIFYTIGLIIFILFLNFFLLSAPTDFPSGTIFRIEQGNNLRKVSLLLKQKNIIRSRTVFEAFVIIYGGEKHIISADYYFENKLSVFTIAKRISKGEHHMVPVVITIPEGFDTAQIANTFSSKLINFNKDKFLLETKELEGYLFPDTYFFFPTANEEDVLESMRENFNKKIKIVLPEIIKKGKTTGRTQQEIIIMASIVEREAKGDTDRGFISGILWKRLAIGMPLQVDAAIETYKTKGLPKQPISNPGLEAIKAAINPQNSLFLYYLHDKDGNIHYAKSFGEHRQNILKYLGN